MKIKCNKCNDGYLVCDFVQAYFLVTTGKSDEVTDIRFEESHYDPVEGDEVYCDMCGDYFSRTEIEEALKANSKG